MFNKILIANRGEIACRIIKTARFMGIHSVAIYSTADKTALHVKEADSAYHVGDALAKDSYLNSQRIIEIGLQSGAQAIHPGYGFLSENPDFAKACEEAGIVFIGPTVAAMEAMASKQVAKQLLESTEVPLTPGYHGLEQSEETLVAEAKKIGFPVLIKAANGGGGKGMRAVYQEAEFRDSLAAAKRESMASFADDTMILEKLVVNPRHVELQIMADNYGNVVHLFERDCSIQRRHQKIIEEAPAPELTNSLRSNLAQAACEVARSIQYRGAGTVEFLVDGKDRFYFMEMNTRLQVEHPVTEMITGLDLVAWQIQIAANNPLPLTQKQIHHKGHAIECRIYAEDAYNEFIPSIGQIDFLKEPKAEGVRLDTGIQCGSSITKYYDPMIAKLIAWGENRDQALQRLQSALSHYYISGVKTNIPFLQAICHHQRFIQAELSTDFLTQEVINLPVVDKELAFIMTAAFDYHTSWNKIKDLLFHSAFSWQAYSKGSWISRYLDEDKVIEFAITPITPDQLNLSFQDKNHSLTVQIHDEILTVQTETQTYSAVIHNKPQALTLYTDQGQITIERFAWNSLQASETHAKGQLTAPMPATIVAVLKKIGDKVKAGERLIILEAMKMEHTIHAPTDGVLQDIFFEVGAQVNEGEKLLSLDNAVS